MRLIILSHTGKLELDVQPWLQSSSPGVMALHGISKQLLRVPNPTLFILRWRLILYRNYHKKTSASDPGPQQILPGTLGSETAFELRIRIQAL